MHQPDGSRRNALVLSALVAATAMAPSAVLAAQPASKSLPMPQSAGGKPLMEALNRRHSTRVFSDSPIPEQDMANMLWAAWGTNRLGGMRTAPSAGNKQSAIVYAVLESGVWEYDAITHELKEALEGDQRYRFGCAPLTLLLAAPDDQFGAMLVGSIYQNVGLYCASTGLGNVVRSDGCDALEGRLPLPAGYKVRIAQSVGWPK